MIERRDRAGLTFEARDAIGVAVDGGRQHLDRDAGAQAGIARLIDLAHAAGANGADDFIRAERQRWHAGSAAILSCVSLYRCGGMGG